MQNTEKFEAFKQRLIKENEDNYGAELQEKYGREEVEASNRKLLHMTEEEYERFTELGKQIIEQLQQAVENGIEPESETGRRIALLHREWLGYTWKSYSAQAHHGLVEMYVADERFQAYYDAKVPGCAAFLNCVVKHWIEA